MIKRLKSEAGYSLVEVMASILILSIAIIPMVGMFDMGLKSASNSGNYDKARAFANRQLEAAKGPSYADVRDTFPNNTGAPGVSGSITSPSQSVADLPADSTYTVTKRYLQQPDVAPTSNSASLTPQGNNTGSNNVLEVTVTVNWGSNSYNATTVKTAP